MTERKHSKMIQGKPRKMGSNIKLFKKILLFRIRKFMLSVKDHWYLMFYSAAHNHLRIQEIHRNNQGGISCTLSFYSFTSLKNYQKKFRVISVGLSTGLAVLIAGIMVLPIFFEADDSNAAGETIPTISSINPVGGPVAGNTNVTISGTNFFPKNTGGNTSWTTLGGVQIPLAMQGSQLLTTGGYIYLFGGDAGASGINSVIYRASTSNPLVWENTGKSLPASIAAPQLVVIGNDVYLLGGYNSVHTTYIFKSTLADPTTWVNTGKSLPGGLSWSQATIVGSNIYLFGGYAGAAGATNVIYTATTADPTTWSVVAGKTLPENIYGSQIAKVGDYLYLFGGVSKTAYLNTIYRAPISDPTTWSLVSGKTLPGNLQLSQLVSIGDYLYLLGGNDGSVTKDVIYSAPINDPTTWSSSGNISLTLHGSSAAVVGGYVYLFGGGNGNNRTYAILRAPVNRFRPNVYNKPWITDWTTIASDQSNVTIGGVSVNNLSVVNSTAITATTPAHAAGAVDVTVTSYDGQSATLANGYSYNEAPLVTGILPTSGSKAGGDSITISGNNFYGTPTVKIGGISATSVSVVNSNTLTALTPAHIAGQFSVQVINPDGQSSLINDVNFVYTELAPTISTITPNIGSTNGGTSVTVSGSNFYVAGKYRKPITISNTNGTTLIDYQVQLIIDTASLISAGKMHSDGGDIRFLDTNGNGNLNYWIESGINTANTKIWVKVPLIPTTGKQIYLVYGNSSNLSLSSTTNTFIREITNVKGAWNMDEASGANLADLSSVNNTGTSTNTTIGGGKLGNARAFNGSNAYVTIPHNTAYNVTDFSINLWFKYSGAGTASKAYWTLINKNGVGDGYRDTFHGFVTPTGYVYFRVGNGSSLVQPLAGSISTTDNAWHMVSVTRNGNSITAYLDGVAGETATLSGSVTTSDPIVLGYWPPYGDYFNGSIDQLNIFNKGLSSSEVADLYSNLPYLTTNYPDKILVRRLATSEPSASLGTEEAYSTALTVGGNSLSGLNVTSDTTITGTTAAHVVGFADVVVVNPNGQTATLSNGYTYTAPPTISGVSPATGSKAGGDSVTITGTNFYGTPSVTFGGTTATNVTLVNSTTLTAITPTHAIGQVNVVVTNPDSQNTTLTNGFTYTESSPTISNISPVNGPVAGGTNVTITGTNFTPKNTGGDVGWANVAGKTIPANIQASKLVTIGEYVYLFGGHDGALALASSAIYRAPVSDPVSWINTGKTLPTAAAASQLAVIGTDIYLFGGYDTVGYNRKIFKSTLADPTTWVDTGTLIPGNLGWSHLSVIGSGIYLFGGYNGSAPTNVIYTAPVSNPTSWTQVAGKFLPDNIYAGQIAMIDNYIYLYGGINATINLNTIYRASIVDPTSWSLVAGKTLPSALALSSLVIIGDKMYLLGGANGSGYTNAIQSASVSDPTTWTTSASVLPGPLGSSSMAVIDNYVYLFGGKNATTQTNVIYRAPLSHYRNNIYNNFWVTNWATVASDQSNVTIGGNPLININVVNATTITGTTAAHTAGATDVTVTNYDGQSATLTSGYTYIAPPTVSEITPGSVTNNQNLSGIIISGQDFQSGASVKFTKSGESDVVCSNVIFNNSTSLTCNADFHGVYPGNWNVIVTNPDNQTGSLNNGLLIKAEIAKMKITTSAQTIKPNAVSNSITIQLQDYTGRVTNAASPISVALGSTSGTGGFSLSKGSWSAVTSVNFLAGENSKTVYYKDSAEGTYTITASENPSQNWTDDSQTITISNNAPFVWPFDNATDYTYDGAKITVADSYATLSDLAAAGTNPEIKNVQSAALSYSELTSFAEAYAPDSQGSMKYQLSKDGGLNWYWFNGSSWTLTSQGVTQSNTAATINTQITQFVSQTGQIGVGKLAFRAFMVSDGLQVVKLDTISVGYKLYPYRYVFTVEPMTLNETETGIYTVQAQDQNGNVMVVEHNTILPLTTTTSATGAFAVDLNEDISTRWDKSSVVIPQGQSSATFYYKDSAKGSKVITVNKAVGENSLNATSSLNVKSKYRLLVTGISDPIQAGIPSSVTVQAVDYNGITTSDYVGALHFASTDSGALLPLDSTLTTQMLGNKTFTNGVTMMTEGEWCVTVTDVSDANITGSQCAITTTAAPSGTASKLKIITNSQLIQVGQTSAPITVQLQDVNNAPVARGVDTTVYVFKSSASGQLSTDGSTWNNGAFALTIKAGATSANFFYKDFSNGNFNLTVSDDAVQDQEFGLTNYTQPISISIGSASGYLIDSAFNDLTAGTISSLINVSLKDVAGNKVAATSNMATYVTSANGGEFSVDGINWVSKLAITINSGVNDFNFYYRNTNAGADTITVSDSDPANGTSGLVDETKVINVAAAAVSQFAFVNAPVNLVVGQTSGNLTIQPRDVYGNVVTAAANTDIYLYSNNPNTIFSGAGVFVPTTKVTITAGRSAASFVFKQTSNVSSIVITASDNASGADGAAGIVDAQQTETLSIGSVKSFVITNSPPYDLLSGSESGALNVETRNAYGVKIPVAADTTIYFHSDSIGNKEFSLNASPAWSAVTQGLITSGTDNLNFYYKDDRSGSHSLTVGDDVAAGTDNGITNAQLTVNVTSQNPTKLVIVSSPMTKEAGEAGIFTVQLQDASNNPSIRSFDTVINLSSDNNGNFLDSGNNQVNSIIIPANSSTRTFQYVSQTIGSHNISVQANGLTFDSQLFTVIAGSPQVIKLSVTQTNLVAGQVSPVINAVLYNGHNVRTKTLTPVTLTLYTSTSGKFDLSAAGSFDGSITSLNIASNSDNGSFYYRDVNKGQINITVSSGGFVDGGITFDISAAPSHHFAFTNNSKNITAGSVSGEITLRVYDQYSNETGLQNDTVVNLSSNSSNYQFSLSEASWNNVGSFTASAGQGQISFYYKDYVIGTSIITVSSTMGAVSQNENIIDGTIQPQPPTKVLFQENAKTLVINTPADFNFYLANDLNQYVLAQGPVDVVLTSNSSTGRFYNPSNSSWETSVILTVAAGETVKTFQYKDSVAGNPIITLTSNGLLSASQQEKVINGQVSKLAIDAVDNANTTDRIAITIKMQTESGLPATSGIIAEIGLTQNANGIFYSSSTGGSPISSVYFGTNESEKNVYFQKTTPGSVIITADENPSQGWQAAQKTLQINAQATHLTFSSAAQAATAGNQSSQITVRLSDAYGNALNTISDLTLYLSSSSLFGQFSKQNGSNWSTVNTLTMAAGTNSATFYYKDTQAGSQNITVSDVSTPAENPDTGLVNATQTLTVTSGSAFSLNFVSAAQNLELGQASAKITIQLRDQHGNAKNADANMPVYFYSSSASAKFSLSNDFSSQNLIAGAVITAGTSTASFYYQDFTVGSLKVTVSDKNSLDNPDQGIVNAENIFTLNNGNVARLAWSNIPATLEKGEVGQLTLKSVNNYGAEIPVASDTVVYLSSSSQDGTFAANSNGPWNISNVTITAGSSNVTLYYKDLTVDNALITASDVSSPAENPDIGLVNAASYLNIITGAITKLAFNNAVQSIIANHPSAQYEIQALNKSSVAANALVDKVIYLRSDSATGEFSLDGISWGVNGVTLLAGNSSQIFFYRDSTAGSHVITAADSLPLLPDQGWTNAQQSVEIQAQQVDHFNVTNISDPQIQGTPSSLVIMPVDAQGYIVKGYSGTITEIAALDGNGNPENAFLPAAGYKFDPVVDKGIKTFTNGVAFYTTGEKTVKVMDANGITGQQQNITVTAGSNGSVAAVKFVDPVSGYTLAKNTTSQLITVQNRDNFNNPININSPSGFEIKITSSSDSAEFSLDGNNWQQKEIHLTIPQNLSFVSFYYKNANKVDETLAAADWNNSSDDANISNDNLNLAITAGPAAYLQLSGGATQVAGSSQALTITANDVDGDIATSYTGTKSIILQGADQALTGELANCTDRNNNPVSMGNQMNLDFSDGVAACQLKVFRQEVATIKANDSAINSYTLGDYNLNVDVVAAAMSEAQSIIDVVPNPQKVNALISVKVNPFDRYRNPILVEGEGGDVKFSVTGANTISDQALVFDQISKAYTSSYYPSKAGIDYITASVAGKSLQKDTELPSDGVFHETVESDLVIPVEETCDFVTFDESGSSSDQVNFKLCLKAGSEVKSDDLSKSQSQSTSIESVKLTAGSEKTKGGITINSFNQRPSEIELNGDYSNKEKYLPYVYLQTDSNLANGKIDKSILKVLISKDWFETYGIESLAAIFTANGKTETIIPSLSQIKSDSLVYEIDFNGFTGSFAILGKVAAQNIVAPILESEEKPKETKETFTQISVPEVITEDSEYENEAQQAVESIISKFFNIDKQTVEKVIETATTVSIGIATLSAGAAAASSVPALLNILGGMRAFGAVPYRKKQRWGVVYDCETGKPLSNTIVIISGEDGKIRELKNTDSLGFYSFLASSGKYSIEVRKAGYESIKNSGILALDTYYDNSYFAGTQINLEEESIVSVNIPMRRISESRVEKLINRSVVTHLVFWIGFAFSGFAMVMSPSYYNGVILAFFVGNFIFTYFLSGGLRVGKIVANDGSAVPFPTVKVFDRISGALVARTVANEKGSFVLVLNEGEYVLEAESGAKKGSKEISLKKRSDVKEKIVLP